MTEKTAPTPAPSEADVETLILDLISRPDAPRTIAPEEPARALASDENWQALLPIVRRTALRLAAEGRLGLYRKGKPVAPEELRGVYRLGRPAQSAGS